MPNSKFSGGFSGQVSIIGGGLVGTLWSLFLVKLGQSVTVYERRPDLRRADAGAGRSINLAISTRGIHALKELGLDQKILGQAIPMKGRMIHSKTGLLSFQPYGKDESECIYSISRGDLNRHLMTEAEQTGKVQFRFKQKIINCDPNTQSFFAQDETTGTISKVKSDFVFGTDGSASVLRQATLQYAKMYTPDQVFISEDVLDYSYKEFHIDQNQTGGHPGVSPFKLEKNALHIWPRGRFMLIALPNFDGSFTVTLFLPTHSQPDSVSFQSLSDDQNLVPFFEQEFPDVVPLIADLKTTYLKNPTGQMVTVRSAPWSIDNWSLGLGDSVHAIVPFFGQGMNCGFEDCSLLFALIKSNPANWTSLVGRFWQARKPDTDAIADLAIENFIEMRDRVSDPRFLLQKEVEKIIETAFPDLYTSKYRAVTFHRAPYREALRLGKIQEELLGKLCEDISSASQVDLIYAKRLIQERLI